MTRELAHSFQTVNGLHCIQPLVENSLQLTHPHWVVLDPTRRVELLDSESSSLGVAWLMNLTSSLRRNNFLSFRCMKGIVSSLSACTRSSLNQEICQLIRAFLLSAHHVNLFLELLL